MKLTIGASRHQLARSQCNELRSADWIHLGEPDWFDGEGTVEPTPPADSPLVLGHYVPFYYQLGNKLPFEDQLFSHALSEHFFEHLYLDEACELLKECFRVLQSGACLRIAVPDADLRTYMAPEPIGFSTGDPRWHHPDKHKTRWSIYSLAYVLEEIGFRTRGLVYCDKIGVYHVDPPLRDMPFYSHTLEMGTILQTSLVERFDISLVVDAIKP